MSDNPVMKSLEMVLIAALAAVGLICGTTLALAALIVVVGIPVGLPILLVFTCGRYLGWW